MARPGVTVASLLCVLLLCAVPAATAQFGDGFPQTGEVEPDAVVLRADVAADGSAEWTIEYRVRLDDENATAAFDGLASEIASNRSRYRSQFRERMETTVSRAENATGREMGVGEVSVVAERRQLPQEYGVVRYSFRWEGFAATDGDQLVVGDALAGLFLDEETRLVVSWPADYEVTTVSPTPDERSETSASWGGPVDFASGQPSVVVAPEGGTAPFPLWLVGVAVLVLGGGGAWYLRRERRTPDASGVSDDTGGPDDADGEAGGAEQTEPPEELLSPEERVLKLLRERGGRMKQQEVVSEFDWTAARTSQVVGNLRDDGEIETFRLGRENVLTLPGEDEEPGETDRTE